MKIHNPNNLKTIDYRTLKEFQGNLKDLNEKNAEKLRRVLEKRGFKIPLYLWNSPDGLVLLDGHQRLRVMQMNQMNDDSSFDVPYIIIEAEDENEAREQLLEISSQYGTITQEGYDEFTANLPEPDLPDVNFDALAFLGQEEEPEVEEDDAPEVSSEPPVSKLGEVYQLGRHRVMCGDSTDKTTVEKLMDGKKADMVFTDPPYGMGKENEGVLNDNWYGDKLLDFNKKWIPLTFLHLKEDGSWYCWGIDEPLMDIYSNILKPMISEQKLTFRNLITWHKSPSGLGDGQNNPIARSYGIITEKCLFVMAGVQGFNNNADNYFEGFEPIRSYLDTEMEKIGGRPKWKQALGNQMGAHYFTRSQWSMPTEENYRKLQDFAKGDALKKDYEELKKDYEELKAQWYETRAYFDNTHENMTEVWQFDRVTQEERATAGGHSTPKPVELCARGIKTSSRPKETVLDVFLGSGSTLIACEQTDRTCYGMELDPKYTDVIRKRWAKFVYPDRWEKEWEALTPVV